MKIVVASENPVKINAVKKAYTRMFPEESFEVVGIPTDSGVPDQPMSNTETLRGAMARAKRASQAHPDALFWVGIEGGLEEKEGEFEAFAWAVVYSHEGMVGKARTGTFFLPPRLAQKIRAGVELGVAADAVFSETNSKRHKGTVGILTHGIIDRTTYYSDLVILACIPFKNKELYS